MPDDKDDGGSGILGGGERAGGGPRDSSDTVDSIRAQSRIDTNISSASKIPETNTESRGRKTVAEQPEPVVEPVKEGPAQTEPDNTSTNRIEDISKIPKADTGSRSKEAVAEREAAKEAEVQAEAKEPEPQEDPAWVAGLIEQITAMVQAQIKAAIPLDFNSLNSSPETGPFLKKLPGTSSLEFGEGEGLPEGGDEYQVLQRDGDGEAVWDWVRWV